VVFRLTQPIHEAADIVYESLTRYPWANYTIPHHQMSGKSRDNIWRAHLKGHGVWPCSWEMVRTEILVTECVLLGDLVAFQSSSEARSTAHALKLKNSTENLAHNFGRQLDPKGACHSVASQVSVLGLTTDVNGLWIGEHMGLLYILFNIEEHTDGSGNLHLG